MAVYREDLVAIELNSGSIHRSFLNHSIGSGDAAANRFGVRVMRNGENVDLTGVSCFGYFRNAEGTNIALTSEGTVSGNVAYVTLPQACYNVEGQFTLSIKLIGGGVTGTMRIVDGVVDNTNTGGAVAPTEDIPTYTEILAVYDQMLEAVEDYAETVEEQNEKIFDLKSAIEKTAEISWTDGYYIGTNGQPISHESYSASDYIEIFGCGIVVVSTEIFDNASCAMYDSNKTMIAYGRNATAANPYISYFNPMGYPDARYIRISSLTESKNNAFIIPVPNNYTFSCHDLNYSYATMPQAYRDCDNLPVNTLFTRRFSTTTEQEATMAHWPHDNFSGSVLTFSNKNYDVGTWGFQIAFSEAASRQEMYYRTRYTTWGSWHKVANGEDLVNLHAIIVNPNYSWASLPVAYRDADALPANTVITYHFGWTEEIQALMLHFPVNPFTGTIVTINSVYAMETFGVQIAFEELANWQRMWYRTRYINYGEWKQVVDASQIQTLSRSSGAYRGLGNFVLCGDSLSVSISYKESASARNVKSWGKILADMIPSECDVFAQGGITTGGYLASNLYTQAVANESQFAILYLGTNDANQQVAAATFKTNYKTIINGLLQNHQFVFCVNLPVATSASTRGIYNTAIAEACEEIEHAFLVDVAKYNDTFAGFKNWGHLSSVGYAAFAEVASWAIDETMLANDYFDAGIDFPELE